MEPATILILFSSFFMFMQFGASKPIVPHISVMGKVYCDTCLNKSFNNHSHTYLLSGAEVRIDCKFNEVIPRTDEQISFSVNRTTNRYGVYRLDMRVPSADGILCASDAAVMNKCRATLIRSTSPSCNTPGLAASTDEFSLTSKHDSVCIYSMFGLSFGPAKKDPAICGK
ncbi:hypothetical protein M8C21_029445 [Ambrosia artemisiifolia]|uniref:Uncharacterized protein n=1 Tax=Ambrosia artemisiifolia TaxID=4212 RepID=A0AAD5GHR4_AMBAR|nr:hypothetical protein M8C21_029445 [Ambrosia artemisiifolia]